MKQNQKILVLGGYGAVGAPLVSELRRQGQEALSAGRDKQRAEVVIDVRDTARLEAEFAGYDAVANASGIEDVEVARAALRAGAAFVDITATTSYVAELERLAAPHPLVLSVGLAPGLTNLLASALSSRTPGPIDLALLLGTGEQHGEAANRWSYRLLGESFRDPATGEAIRNYTHPKTFVLPSFGKRRLLRTDFSDQHTLSRELGVPVRSYFGLDNALATWALRVMTWAPSISRSLMDVAVPGSEQWLALARAENGSSCYAWGTGQSHATAIMTARAIDKLPELGPGVHHSHQFLSLEDVPRGRGIQLESPTPERPLGIAVP